MNLEAFSYDAGRPNSVEPSPRFPLHAWDRESVAAFERLLGPSNDMSKWTQLPSLKLLETTLDELAGVQPIQLILELFERQIARTSILMSINAQLQREVAELQEQLHHQTSFITQLPPDLPFYSTIPNFYVQSQLSSSSIDYSSITDISSNGQTYPSKKRVIVGLVPPQLNGSYPPKATLSAYQNGYAAYCSRFRASPQSHNSSQAAENITPITSTIPLSIQKSKKTTNTRDNISKRIFDNFNDSSQDRKEIQDDGVNPADVFEVQQREGQVHELDVSPTRILDS
ncbi:hypothetical protein V1514DRAFT_25943 [Lipomyces japonicus]|uniref:uncharacterized protein n=1 Tax=Lipomyces japonicus TaxID=56871 RepID=UPI0034CFF5F2